VVVPDRSTALWLSRKFPGCAVTAIDGMPSLAKGRPGRPRIHESAAVRQARHRQRKREELLAALAALQAANRPSAAGAPASPVPPGHLHPEADARSAGHPDIDARDGCHPGQNGRDEMPPGQDARSAGHPDTDAGDGRHPGTDARAEPPGGEACGDENTYKEGFRNALEPQGGGVFATLYHDLYSEEPAHRVRCRDMDEFVGALRDVWSMSIGAKGATAKFIPADLDPGMAAESRRGTANVHSAHVLVLDNDGGDLTRDEFARLFPRWRMLFVNTYSSAPACPRWRVFIPCDMPVTAELYRLFTERMMSRLNRAGYWSKQQLADNPRIRSRLRHGFDMVKLGAASIFDLPSQAGAGPEASFFEDVRDGRAPLDVDALLRWLTPRREAPSLAEMLAGVEFTEDQLETLRRRAEEIDRMAPEDLPDIPDDA
jgi:hypothetical protein